MTIVVAPHTPPKRSTSLEHHFTAANEAIRRHASSPSCPSPSPRSPLDPSSEDDINDEGRQIISTAKRPYRDGSPRHSILKPIDLYTGAGADAAAAAAAIEPVTHRKLRDEAKPRHPFGPPVPAPRRLVASSWSTKRPSSDAPAPAPPSSSRHERSPNGESPPKRPRRPSANLQHLLREAAREAAREDITQSQLLFGMDIDVDNLAVLPPPQIIITPAETTTRDAGLLATLSINDTHHAHDAHDAHTDPALMHAIAERKKVDARLRTWFYSEVEGLVGQLVTRIKGEGGRAGNYAQMERNTKTVVLAMERMLGLDPHHSPDASNVDFLGDGRHTFMGSRRQSWWASSLRGTKLLGDDGDGSHSARLQLLERRALITKFLDEVFIHLDLAPVPLSLPEALGVVCSKLLSRPDLERVLVESKPGMTFADRVRKYQRGPRKPSTWRHEGTMRASRLRRVASVEYGGASTRDEASPQDEPQPARTLREMLLARFDDLLQRGHRIKERSHHLQVPLNPRNTLRWKAYLERESHNLDIKMTRIKSRAARLGNDAEKTLAVNGRLEETFASLHCVRFLGELYRQGIVDLAVVEQWLHRLLFDTTYPGIPSLWELESGCVLLITILPKLHEYQRQDGRVITMQRSFSAPYARVETSGGHGHGHGDGDTTMACDRPTPRQDAATADHWISTTPRSARLSALSKHSPVRKADSLPLDLTRASASANIVAASLLHSCLCRLRELQAHPEIHVESKAWIAEVCRLSEGTPFVPRNPSKASPPKQQRPVPTLSSSSARPSFLFFSSSSGSSSGDDNDDNDDDLLASASPPSSRHRLKIEREQRKEMERELAQLERKAQKAAKAKARRVKKKNTQGSGGGDGGAAGRVALLERQLMQQERESDEGHEEDDEL